MSIEVILKYDPTWKALEWAKSNCPSYITNAMSDRNWTHRTNPAAEWPAPKIIYYFSNEKEALMFQLKWAS